LIAQVWTKEQLIKYYEDLGPYCPHFWIMPFRGLPVFAVQELEKRGGPGFYEKWLPATHMIEWAYQARFPKCSAQRKIVGLVAETKGCFDGWLKVMVTGLD